MFEEMICKIFLFRKTFGKKVQLLLKFCNSDFGTLETCPNRYLQQYEIRRVTAKLDKTTNFASKYLKATKKP